MGGQTQLEAAKFIGISKSNITRWKNGARADPDFVVKVARAYGANVLEALVEAEFITEKEAQLREVAPTLDLEDISADALLDELQRRVDRFNFIKNLEITDEPDMTLEEAVDELEERRSMRPTPSVSPTSYSDDIPEDAVAYHDDEMGGTPDDFEP
ncbi:Helix-turn-helix protein [Corynebacterium ciconiae DSM 44920]|nr:Helix-turn-helix protein [Corynebacterium ciconiae DSM 44920]